MENHYSHFTKDLSTKIGFEGSEITLNIPEDGENKEGSMEYYSNDLSRSKFICAFVGTW